jgi:hypothetical protein
MEGPMRRFFAFPLVRMILIVAAFVAAGAGLYTLRAAGIPLGEAALGSILLAVLLAIILVVERLTVARGPADIGFDPRHLVRDVLFGLFLGGALFSAVILELAAAHAYRIESVHASSALFYAALWLVPAAALEEVLVRGVVFRLLAEWSGTWIALALSALLFGAMHFFNPGATWFSTFAIALEAGVLLAAAFIVTRSLWLPIALHFAWNFCEGPIYGTQLSGMTIGAPLFHAQISGAAWLTGESFGPEASVPALLTATAVAAALLIYAQRHGSIVPCPWLRSSKVHLATAAEEAPR